MKNLFYSTATYLTLTGMLYLSSCSEMIEEQSPVAAQENEASRLIPETAYPNTSGVEKKGKLFGKDITYTEINGEAVFEGDIILSKEQLRDNDNARTDGAGVSYNAQRWPDGIVYYSIDKSVINTGPVYSAVSAVQISTSVKFVPRTNQYNYVTFKVGRGFSSSIGIVGGQQFINLGLAYKAGSVLHEIGHTLGLFHEHTRLDRDKTIKINYNNINPGIHSYFQTYQASGYSGFELGTLDLNSIMMLDSYSYSSNDQPTMTKLDGSTFTTQRMYLSSGDMSAINSMYANMYAIRFGSLYAADNRLGKQAMLAGNWANTQAVTSDPNFVYAAKTVHCYASIP